LLQIESARNLSSLNKLWERIQHFTVLDPACGAGNFLYIAYRELKRLEARILQRMQEFSTQLDPTQRFLGFVTAKQFYGIDINPFAVELAKVTMMIARKLAIDELQVTEAALPLDNLDANFSSSDALIDSDGGPVSWPKVDVIIGNPPFIRAKRTWGKPFVETGLFRIINTCGALPAARSFGPSTAHENQGAGGSAQECDRRAHVVGLGARHRCRPP
jgi:type I restriction-modification system DNA methylase subunit